MLNTWRIIRLSFPRVPATNSEHDLRIPKSILFETRPEKKQSLRREIHPRNLSFPLAGSPVVTGRIFGRRRWGLTGGFAVYPNLHRNSA